MASSGFMCFIDMREAGILMWFQLRQQHLAAFGSRWCRFNIRWIVGVTLF